MKIIFIGGATGTGKTDLAIKIHQMHNAYLISCDSVQIYKNLDVGSNKSDRVDIHSLIDVADFDEIFDVETYIKYVEEQLLYCEKNGLTPIIVGGTGFYMQRLDTSRYDTLKIFLVCDRLVLYRKTDERCEKMIENGFLSEVLDLKNNGLSLNVIPGRAIGYRDAIIFLNKLTASKDIENHVHFNEFLHNFKRRTRNLIRSQETFFRKKEYIWIDINKFDPYSVIQLFLNKAVKFTEHFEFVNNISRDVNKNAFKKCKTYKPLDSKFTEKDINRILKNLEM
ncbi:hypothetical protein EDEG_02639 [Edhazardia aedis USNM 41457]|uniref:tRNA dimethylallyltransferase n=1 Tax=Edhazardia aedis (strain USNM 41457) TaxID=1003232 RepID=J9DK58_EDHAE|nr:hypothetical protein EDEG_02639 [Edhazardia aedis USNM 41457]|eukprot:EJW02995.1 hypothetical protein EDEG_02639 [Edhazardia aedis USNM 41457]